MLSAIRVLDFTNRLGWIAGRILADLGADVVKVEPPGTDTDDPAWAAHNLNKRRLVFDWLAGTAEEALGGLARGTDIVLETAPPGSAEARRFDRARRCNARLIHVSITPLRTHRSAVAVAGERSGADGGRGRDVPGRRAARCAGPDHLAAIGRVGRRRSGHGCVDGAARPRAQRARPAGRRRRTGRGDRGPCQRPDVLGSRARHPDARRRFHHRPLGARCPLPGVLAVPRRLCQLHPLRRRRRAAHPRAAGELDAADGPRSRGPRRHRLVELQPHRAQPGRGRCHRGAHRAFPARSDQAGVSRRRL